MRISRADAARLNLDFDALRGRARGTSPAVAPGEPALVSIDWGPGRRWVAAVTSWRPASDNLRARGVRAWAAAKARDRDVIRRLLAGEAGIPPATGRRKVTLLVEKANGRGVTDSANLLKSLHDGLKTCGLIVDDDELWLDWDRPRIVVNREMGCPVRTTIILEDVP